MVRFYMFKTLQYLQEQIFGKEICAMQMAICMNKYMVCLLSPIIISNQKSFQHGMVWFGGINNAKQWHWNCLLNFIFKVWVAYLKIFQLKFEENVGAIEKALHYKKLIGGKKLSLREGIPWCYQGRYMSRISGCKYIYHKYCVLRIENTMLLKCQR
jgi:hypothetical protein